MHRKAIKIVVTAGPTREFIDPVRFLSNPSTGKMGFAVAAEAARRGHEVVLVAGPVSLPTPKGVRRVDVVSARDSPPPPHPLTWKEPADEETGSSEQRGCRSPVPRAGLGAVGGIGSRNLRPQAVTRF